jgi:hypothetical protein
MYGQGQINWRIQCSLYGIWYVQNHSKFGVVIYEEEFDRFDHQGQMKFSPEVEYYPDYITL